VCRQFDAAWRAAAATAGPRPCIGDYINDFQGPECLALLRELLCLDVEYRSLAGEQPVPEDYLSQFPDQAQLIHAAFSQQPAAAGGPQAATGPAPKPLPEVPGYEVLEAIGRGGMGVVYKARQVKANRLVALKMMLSGASADPAERARFLAEARAAARLPQTGFVSVFEVNEHDGRPYFSMELCGDSLKAKLAGAPMRPDDATALVVKLARAMQAAHKLNVVHRDLKPPNVLFAADGAPKIADFGLAKMLDEKGWTETGAVLGTAPYMPPEQAQGKRVGPAADVYALGAILYECLTGRPPFKAATMMETLLQVISEEPVSPRHLNKQVGGGLAFVCMKCLEKDPDRRYPSADELAADLERCLNGGRIPQEPWWRWLWRQFQSRCRLDHPREWAQVFYYLAAWRVICHGVMAVLLQLGPAPAAYWAWFIGLHVGTWLPVWWLLRSERLNPIERGALLNWGATFACDALLFALFCPPWGQARPDEVVRVYSAWPAAHGLWYVAEGRRSWGRFYAVGLGYFVAAPLLSLCGLLAPVAYALVVASALLSLGEGLRRLAKQQADDRRKAQKAAAGGLPASSEDRC
jgi:tRNA A-37 threonylcarbamoyl transferase component Bud32